MSIRSNGQFHRGESGFYVVNQETDISNYGPYTTHAKAERVRREIIRDYGEIPGLVIVAVDALDSPEGDT